MPGRPSDARAAHPSLPIVWRIPPWQVALLILVATGSIAWALYGHLSAGATLMAAVVAAAALVGAVFGMRYALVADDEGLWVRRVFAQHAIEWADVADIDTELVHRNLMTVRITRGNGSFLDVPPSLLQPTLPTNVRRAHARVAEVARILAELARDRGTAP